MPITKVRRSFILNKKTGERHCINDVDTTSYEAAESPDFSEQMMYRADQLPPRVDLRRWMTPVENQGKTCTCTANAIAGACEYLIKKSSDEHIDVSRLFIYYNARKRKAELTKIPVDITKQGSSIPHAIDTLKFIGVCQESVWPFDPKAVNKKPSSTSYDAAKEYLFPEAMQVKTNLIEMKTCLAQGFPFVFALYLFSTFDKAQSDGGLVPMPDTAAIARKTHRAHAMLAVGYSDKWQTFIVRNSWGTEWGKEGYCFIPYQYMTNPALCYTVYAVMMMIWRSLTRMKMKNILPMKMILILINRKTNDQ